MFDEVTLEALRERVGEDYLALRLRAQVDRTLRVKGHGRSRFHLENVRALYALLERFLRLTGLHETGRRNALDVQVRERAVYLPGLPRGLDGLRILQITDLHLDGHPGIGANAAAAIRGQQFDVCVITGDFRWRVSGNFAQIEADMRALMPALACPLGVYGILGNHDVIEMVPFLQRLGVRMLLNEAVELPFKGESLWLVGLDDPHYYGLHDFQRGLARVPPDAACLLLVHSPEVIEEACRHYFLMYLTGHTHAGQICLPNGRPLLVNARCARQYAAYAWQHGALAGYTSAGIGASGVFARFFCPPEAVIHELRASAVHGG